MLRVISSDTRVIVAGVQRHPVDITIFAFVSHAGDIAYACLDGCCQPARSVVLGDNCFCDNTSSDCSNVRFRRITA
jgi:hypothetical protein